MRKIKTEKVILNLLYGRLSKWIDVNKVDKKSDRGEKIGFKICRRKKIDSRMRTFCIVKSVKRKFVNRKKWNKICG